MDYFYPRSPCGERLQTLHQVRHMQNISIHALLAESECSERCRMLDLFIDFYPRSPCGERWDWFFTGTLDPISIHALLAESDLIISMVPLLLRTFLSTLSLRRACIVKGFLFFRHKNFYPRSPCGERQPALYQLYDTYAISIHALLAESDSVLNT